MGQRTGRTVWDYVVVGGGTAGLVGARTAASFGARVLLIDRARPGGDCLWTGCVPSKTLLAASGVGGGRTDAASTAPSPDTPTGRDARFTAAMTRVQDAIRTIEPVDSFAALNDAGIETIAGDATFTGRRGLLVDDRPIDFRQALIATGAAPLIPDLPGLDAVDYLTSETIWSVDRLPARLLIIGGGPISCELGQAFAHLGFEVTLASRNERLLAHEDAEAAALITSALAADGVHVRSGTAIARIQSTRTGRGGIASLSGGREIPFDALLIATGRRPRTAGLGLSAAGVTTDERGYVVVDRHLQTGNPWIRAAGDVTPRSHHTHTAGVHGSLAASNAILGLSRAVDDRGPARVTFTSPELAAIGAPTDPGRTNDGTTVLVQHHEHNDRAITTGQTSGFTKLVLDRSHRIVGATVVGPRAGETLGEISLAIHKGLRTRDLASVTHAYPTYNDAVWNAAIADVRQTLASGAVGKATRLLSRVRRGWVRVRQERRR